MAPLGVGFMMGDGVSVGPATMSLGVDVDVGVGVASCGGDAGASSAAD